MLATELEVVPLSASLGAELRGVDATKPPPPAVVQRMKELAAEFGCILLRGQRLSEEQHAAFAEAWGETIVPWLHAVELNTLARMDELPGRPGYTGKHPGSVYFFNGPAYRDKPEDGYLQGWHADMTHLQVPLHYAMLNAVVAPEHGYQTWFSNQTLAFERLDPETRQRVERLTIEHSFRHVFPALPPVIHPVALTHPISGRKAIYGIPGVADPSSLRLPAAEEAALLARLTAHLEDDAFLYKHSWRTGDLMIWDNRCVLHRRGPQAGGQTRVLRRIMAGDGDPPTVRRLLMGYA